MVLRFTKEEFAARLVENQDLGISKDSALDRHGEQASESGAQPPEHKYRARRTVLGDGRKYPSGKQARYAQELDLRVKAGEVLWYLEEVPFRLPGGVKYRLDVLEFHADGTVHLVEVKGKKTAKTMTTKTATKTMRCWSSTSRPE